MKTYQDIMNRIAELQAQADEIKQAEVGQVIAEIKTKIAEYGITSSDLYGKGGAKARKAVAVKYRDGNGNTWTGRGKRPNWLTSALSSGATLEQFAV